MTYSESQEVDEGIAPLVVYVGAWAIEFAVTYWAIQ